MSQIINSLKNSFKKKKFAIKNSNRWQNKLDHKLVYNLNKKRLPNFRQVIKFPTILSLLEKKILLILIFLFISSSVWWSLRFYQSHLVIFPASGGEYTEGLIGLPNNINPILIASDVERDLSSLIFSGLLKRDKTQQLVVDLAESYEISEDQKNYTLKLRKDVLWHDGEKFDSDDVIFTIESIQNPDYNSPLSVSFGGVLIRKIDDYTVKFILEAPYAPFLNILTVGILPEHLWSNIEASNVGLAFYNLEPIGTGAWEFVKLTKDKASGSIKNIKIEKFDKYYNDKPFLDKLIFKFYPDFVQAIDALKNKNVQGLSFISKEEKENISNLKYVDFNILNLPQYTALFFNQKNNNSLRDINVRTALALSIDKNLIIEKAISSEGEPIYGPILPGYIGYSPSLEKYELDINKANTILDKNKWIKITADEVVESRKEEYAKQAESLDKQIEEKKIEENKTPEESEKEKVELSDSSKEESAVSYLTLEDLIEEKEKIVTKITRLEKLKNQEFYRKNGNQILKIKLTTIDRGENITAIELIKEMWSKIGVEVDIEIIDKSRIQKDIIRSRNYETLLFSESVGFDPDPYPFWHSSQNQDPGLNLAIFSNDEVDTLLEEARQTTDEQIRSDKYINFQNILTKELPAIFLYNPTYTYPFFNKIQGFDISRISLPSDRLNNIEEWYIKTKGEFDWK